MITIMYCHCHNNNLHRYIHRLSPRVSSLSSSSSLQSSSSSSSLSPLSQKKTNLRCTRKNKASCILHETYRWDVLIKRPVVDVTWTAYVGYLGNAIFTQTYVPSSKVLMDALLIREKYCKINILFYLRRILQDIHKREMVWKFLNIRPWCSIVFGD